MKNELELSRGRGGGVVLKGKEGSSDKVSNYKALSIGFMGNGLRLETLQITEEGDI